MRDHEIRERITAYALGELSAEEEAALHEEIAGREDLRRRIEQLRSVRHKLGELDEPAVRVDVPRLYRAAMARSDRARRRWRIGTVAACAAAGVMIAWAAASVRVQWSTDRLVLAWGRAGAAGPAHAQDLRAELTDQQRKLNVLGELVHLALEEIETQDWDHRLALARLADHFNQETTARDHRILLANRASAQRLRALEQDLSGLYRVAQNIEEATQKERNER